MHRTTDLLGELSDSGFLSKTAEFGFGSEEMNGIGLYYRRVYGE